jgi:hypothetical protein
MLRKMLAPLFLAAAVAMTSQSALAEKFTVAVIPDTQNYCDNTKSQPSSLTDFLIEANYLVDQKTAKNIVFTSVVGDVVQHGDGTNGISAVYGGTAEWDRAKSAYDKLSSAGMAFGMTPGNHDYNNYSYSSGSRPLQGSTLWNQYFGATSSYFAGKSWYGGASTGLANTPGMSSYQMFSGAGKTYLSIELEMEAGGAALAWAQNVINTHPGVPTIVTTHEYLSPNSDSNGVAIRLNDGYMSGSPAGMNSAQQVWDKFVSQNDQVFLVVCGHSWNPTDANGVSQSENFRSDLNAFGHPVYQVLNDYQGNTIGTDSVVGHDAGGDGWLRFMEFDTDAGTIHFYTYSPVLDQYAGQNGENTFNQPASFSDFTVPIPSQVPEPATMALLALGGMGILLRGRRKRTLR